MSKICRVSYLETFHEKKIREKLTGEKLQGGCSNPLGCIRVNWLQLLFHLVPNYNVAGLHTEPMAVHILLILYIFQTNHVRLTNGEMKETYRLMHNIIIALISVNETCSMNSKPTKFERMLQ